MPAVGTDDFDAQVLGAPGLVLVDFWAPWCAPCAKVGTVVEQIALDHGAVLAVRGLDVEAHPGPASRYDVLSLPTLILFRDGEAVLRLTGAPSRKKIDKALAPFISPA